MNRYEEWEKNKPPHMTIGENTAYEAGAKAERKRLMALVEKEYPAVTCWPFWKKLTEGLEG